MSKQEKSSKTGKTRDLDVEYDECLKLGEMLVDEKTRIEEYSRFTETFNESRMNPEFQKQMSLDESFKLVNDRRIEVDKWEREHREKVKKWKKMVYDIESEIEERDEDEEDKRELEERNYKIALLIHEMANIPKPDYGLTTVCPNCRVERRFKPNATSKQCCSVCGFILGVAGNTD